MFGIELDVFVSDWFWDGKTEAEKVFNVEFAGQGPHVFATLEKSTAMCSGGFKSACPTLIDMIAVLLPFAFHIAAKLFLQQLTQANQTSAVAFLNHETRTKSPFRFITKNEMLSAKWASSHDDCNPLFTRFAPNVVESNWRVAHLARGETEKQIVKSEFASLQRQWNTWDHRKSFQTIEHEPCGTFLHQPSLIRGSGLCRKRTSLHHKRLLPPHCDQLQDLH